jgi:hypothetical protein
MTRLHLSANQHAILLLVLLLLAAPASTANSCGSAPWSMLEFERKSIWGTANSRIELKKKSSAEVESEWQNPARRDYLMPLENVWELTVAATVGSNEAHLQLLLAPNSAAIYQRNRFTIGRKNRRNKFYRYHADGVTRVRRDPLPGEVDLPPAQWSKTSLEEVSFPHLPANSVVTTPYALLILASSLPFTANANEGAGRGAEIYIHTDHNLYQVDLERGEDSSLQASYLLYDSNGKDQRHEEKRRVETIHLRAHATAHAPDKPDFELLGLRGELTLLVDSETRLPLRLMGTAPRLGKAHLDLKTATLPDSAPCD